jgi:hypothetical protein
MIDGPTLWSDGEIDWNVKPVSKQSVAFSLGMKDNRCLGAIGRTGARKI